MIGLDVVGERSSSENRPTLPNSAVLVAPAYIMVQYMAAHVKDKGYLQRNILSKTQRQRPLLPIVPTSLVQAGDNLPESPTSAHCCFGVSQVNQVNMSRSRVSEKSDIGQA